MERARSDHIGNAGYPTPPVHTEGYPLATSEYRYHRRVEFQETDLSGLVHFSCFFRYLEEAEHAMWRSAGLSIAPRGSEIGWPRLAASFEYRKPLRFEDEFEVHLRITSKARKTMRYRAVLRMNGDIVAVGALTVICVRRRPGEPITAIDIPPEIASRFEVAPPEEVPSDAQGAAEPVGIQFPEAYT
jgi:acyl-CoA thioester hydrolase